MRHRGRYHQNLVLENFTAFKHAELDFVPGVNAIIGANGTGKTHILKALYAAQLTWVRNGGRERLESVFQLENSVSDLIRSGHPRSKICSASGTYGGEAWSFGIQRARDRDGAGEGDGAGDGSGSGSGRGKGDGTGEGSGSGAGRGRGDGTGSSESSERDDPTFVIGAHPPTGAVTPVFVPAIDMMGHTRGFVSTFDNYRIDFDLTHREIVSLLLSPEKRELDEHAAKLISDLSPSLGGTVVLKGERFYLDDGDRQLPMPSVAEGLRKIATLVRLAQSGWLSRGSTLFWDEPEVNLNPILMDEVVGAILALTRSGVQVFLATHSYVILKELEVQSVASDSLRFFALDASADGSRVHRASKYLELEPNKIEQQYGDLYDRSVDKAMGAIHAP